MVDQQLLGRVLKEAMKSGKYTLGTREVLSEIRTSKVVIASAFHSSKDEAAIRAEAEKNKVPLVVVNRSSSQLGRLLGRPYKVSALALRSINDSDLRQLQS